MNTSSRKKIKSTDFDTAFEKGDVSKHLNLKTVKTHYPVQRVSIDFPKNILEGIDIEAAKIGVTRTSLIKMWVAERVLADAH
jgi:hypothetical protein